MKTTKAWARINKETGLVYFQVTTGLYLVFSEQEQAIEPHTESVPVLIVPDTQNDGSLDAEASIFCCGEPIWPKGKHPFRAEFSMSCGWVIVDPDGRESTLGYARQKQAEDVAAMMTYAYWQGARRHGEGA